MKIAFFLSMPGVGSWNGRWSGEGNLYAIVRSVPKKRAEDIKGRSFGHNFGDGWYASVEANEVDAQEARKLRKNSKGFCGYEWMVDSIIQNGEIKCS